MDMIEEIRKKYAPGTFLMINADTVESAYRDMRFLISHINGLEKRVKAFEELFSRNTREMVSLLSYMNKLEKRLKDLKLEAP